MSKSEKIRLARGSFDIDVDDYAPLPPAPRCRCLKLALCAAALLATGVFIGREWERLLCPVNLSPSTPLTPLPPLLPPAPPPLAPPSLLQQQPTKQQLHPVLRVADLAADNTWVEVQRVAPTCFAYTHSDPEFIFGSGAGKNNYSEGLTPWYNVPATTFLAPSKPDTPWPYGCWFLHSVTGSGVWVNVKRSLRAETRQDVAKALDIPDGSDANWCKLAMEKGYDSIQVAKAHIRSRTELTICYGGCVTSANPTACPPPDVPLRTGVNASDACACDDASTVLNCGRKAHIARTPHLQVRDAGVQLPSYASSWLQTCASAMHLSQWLYHRACESSWYGARVVCVSRPGGYRE